MENEQHEGHWSAGRRQLSNRSTAEQANHGSGARFGVAISIFLAVALAYPWYSYWVSSYLLTRELEAAGREFAKVSGESLREMRKQAMQSAEASKREQQRRRISNVKIKGVSDGPGGHVVIVEMGSASLVESDETICNQASTWLKLDLSGSTLRIQRYRLNQPALDFGAVTCP